MNSLLRNLKSQLSDKLPSDHKTKSTILLIVQDAVRQISKQMIKVITSIDYSQVMLRLDQLKCDWMNLQINYKKGYNTEAQKQIKRQFQKQIHTFISQKNISGKMSYSTIKPRLSSRQKYQVSSRNKKDIVNCQDISSKLILNKKLKQSKNKQNKDNNKSIEKNSKNRLDMTYIGSILHSRDKKQNSNKSILKVPSTGRKKPIFK